MLSYSRDVAKLEGTAKAFGAMALMTTGLKVESQHKEMTMTAYRSLVPTPASIAGVALGACGAGANKGYKGYVEGDFVYVAASLRRHLISLAANYIG